MRDIANRLERLCCINRDIGLAQGLPGCTSDRLLSLRADFAFECSQLFNQLTGKLNCSREIQIASRILDAFVSMQHALAIHQRKWPLNEIDNCFGRYQDDVRELHALVINFIEDSLEMIEASSPALRRPQTARRPIAPPVALRLTGTR